MTAGASPDRKRKWLMVLMWLAAIGASWAVYQQRNADSTRATVVTQPPATTTMHPLGPLAATAPTQYRSSRRHTGRSPFTGPVRASVRWKQDLGARVTGQPVIDAAGNIYVGTHAGVLWALNSEGITLWRRELGARIFAAALIGSDGNLYVGTDGRGFQSLDDKGNPRFTIRTDGDADTAPVLAHDGTIRFVAGHQLYAIDPDGRVRWTFDAGAKIFTSPTLDDAGTAYFGAQDDHVYAVDADGKQRFRYKTKGDVDVTPVIDDDGSLYVGSDDQHVYGLTLGGGLRWATRLDGYVRGAIALGADNTVLATHCGPRGALVALDRTTGETRFRFAFALTNRADTGVRGGALVDATGAIYVGADDDYLYALSPDGKLRWAMPIGSDLEASTALSPDGTLYAVSAKGLLYAIGGNQ